MKIHRKILIPLFSFLISFSTYYTTPVQAYNGNLLCTCSAGNYSHQLSIPGDYPRDAPRQVITDICNQYCTGYNVSACQVQIIGISSHTYDCEDYFSGNNATKKPKTGHPR